MKKSIIATGLAFAMAMPFAANAADYVIDTKGAHASVNFKVSHLGYSFIQGRFNTFSGDFSYAENNVEASKIPAPFLAAFDSLWTASYIPSFFFG